MKECVLFVGREQPLWQQFRSYVLKDTSRWAAEFATTGREALAKIRRSEFAAVVADFQLPDGRGLEILDEVLRCRPDSFRLVLSSLSDLDATVQCLGKGHHHLATPCELAKLLQALNRADAEEAWRPGHTVQKLLADMRRVPSPPTVYFQIVAEIESEEVSVHKIGKIIAQDPATTAKVLQLANSALFGLRSEVCEPGEAVTYIGLEATKSLVLMAHSFSAFDQIRLAGFSGRVFGASHAELGGCLLDLWGLPTAIVEAVALHHTPGLLPPRGFSPLTAVHVANVLAGRARQHDPPTMPADLDRQYLKSIGLEHRLAEWQSACAVGHS
ncbi:hypothetical protein SBV1_140016 [Verrucomicrobia bacterium]|nr:hypothetical protein SBV1_140016 [Verrucomicrobiota bacterium]